MIFEDVVVQYTRDKQKYTSTGPQVDMTAQLAGACCWMVQVGYLESNRSTQRSTQVRQRERGGRNSHCAEGIALS